MKKKSDNHDIRNRVIVMIIIIIIIILLLLHSCVGNKGNKSGICVGDDCDGKNSGLVVSCMKDVDNPTCIVPNFRGKTEDDVNAWLDKISNNIETVYIVYDSDEEDGIIINQSIEDHLRVKDLLDENRPLIIFIANSRKTKVDCLSDPKNEKCIVPDFTGKTKQDVYEWLDRISNNLNVEFEGISSKEKSGTIIKQSIKSGTKVKDIIEKNKELNITFANNEKVDCLKDENNSRCVVPNLTGYTQKEIQEWLDSIANAGSIVLDYENSYSDAKSGTVLSQSANPGTSIKDLIDSGTPLTITFATNNKDNKLDCLNNPNNYNCVLPDFTGKTKEEVESWLSNFSNNIPVRYEKVTSDETKGNIISQSIESGTSVKDILDNNQQLVIVISGGKKSSGSNNNNNNNNNNQQTEPEDDTVVGEVIVKDSSVTWEIDTVVDIFTNSLANDKIAPESSNTYSFTVYNNTNSNVKYNLTFSEENNHNINMKYKLRKNNSYIVSEYSSINELNLTNQLLNANKNDVFYLEWKWISSNNDTDIGSSGTATYKLNLKVEAESVNE